MFRRPPGLSTLERTLTGRWLSALSVLVSQSLEPYHLSTRSHLHCLSVPSCDVILKLIWRAYTLSSDLQIRASDGQDQRTSIPTERTSWPLRRCLDIFRDVFALALAIVI